MSKGLRAHSLREAPHPTAAADAGNSYAPALAEAAENSHAIGIAAVPQLQLLRFLQLSAGEDISDLSPNELGLELPHKLHHVSKGSSRKDCPFGYRVRTCNQCSPGLRIDLGTYAFIQDALLVNDAWQLMFGNTSKLQLLRVNDREWLHLLYVRRFLRRTSQVVTIKDILDTVCTPADAGPSAGPATRSNRHHSSVKRSRSPDPSEIVKTEAPDNFAADSGQLVIRGRRGVVLDPQAQERQRQHIMLACLPANECRFMMVNHAESLLSQFSHVESMTFSVMRVGYEHDDNARLDGYHMLSVLLRRHPQQMAALNAQEVYKSPIAALHRLYASLCGKVLASVVSQTRSSILSADIFETLDLKLDHQMHAKQPSSKSVRAMNTQQVFRDIVSSHDGDIAEFLTRVEVFAINILADAWWMLSEESLPYTFRSEPTMGEAEIREVLGRLYEQKVQHEISVRTCVELVQAKLRPENDPELNELIHRSLNKLRSAYLTIALQIFSHESRVSPFWEEEGAMHLCYGKQLATMITCVFGKRLHLLPARPAGVVSDHRLGALVAKAWDDVTKGIQPKMMAVDAAALDSVSRRFALYGTLAVHPSRFDHSDHPAESEIQALTSLLQYICLRERVAQWDLRTPTIVKQSLRDTYSTLAPVDLEALESCEDETLFEDALTELYPELNKGNLLQAILQDLSWYLSFSRTEGVGALFPSGLRSIFQLFYLLTCNCDDVDSSLRYRMISMCKQLIDINRQTCHLGNIVAMRAEAVQSARATIFTFPTPGSRTPPEFPTEISGMSPTNTILEQVLRDENFDDFFNLVEEAQLPDSFFNRI